MSAGPVCLAACAGRTSAVDVTRTSGGAPGRWNFRALPIRFCRSCRTCSGSASTVGSAPTSTPPAGLLDPRLQVRHHLAASWFRSDRAERLGLGRHAAEGEQVVDQRLHPPGGVLHPGEIVLALRRPAPRRARPSRSPNAWILRSGSWRSWDATDAKSCSSRLLIWSRSFICLQLGVRRGPLLALFVGAEHAELGRTPLGHVVQRRDGGDDLVGGVADGHGAQPEMVVAAPSGRTNSTPPPLDRLAASQRRASGDGPV